MRQCARDPTVFQFVAFIPCYFIVWYTTVYLTYAISIFPPTYRPSSPWTSTTLSAAEQRRRRTSGNAVRTGRASLSYYLFTWPVRCHCVSANNDFIILLLLQWWFAPRRMVLAVQLGPPNRSTQRNLNLSRRFSPFVVVVVVISEGDSAAAEAITVLQWNHNFVMQCPANRNAANSYCSVTSTVHYYNLCFFFCRLLAAVTLHSTEIHNNILYRAITCCRHASFLNNDKIFKF